MARNKLVCGGICNSGVFLWIV